MSSLSNIYYIENLELLPMLLRKIDCKKCVIFSSNNKIASRRLCDLDQWPNVINY